MTTTATAAKIAEITLAQGGATIDVATGEARTSGVAVAVKGFERVVPVEGLAAFIADFLAENAEVLARPGHHLGTWVSDRKVYLDVSEVVASREEGIRLGRARGELAVFDLDALEEIQTA